MFLQTVIGRDGLKLQQLPSLCQLLYPVGIGYPAVMADAVEASGQYMNQEPANELIGIQCHDLVSGTSLLAIVLPLEGDTVLIQGEQSAVGDSDPVGIAREVGQYRLRPGKGFFGVD